MANSPESSRHIPSDFRAPPPSPVASGRQSSVANDEVLTEFLRSLHVPDLVLPDRAFPRQNPKIQSLPKLDVGAANVFDVSKDRGFEDVMEAIAKTECFELVNHEISDRVLSSIVNSGAGVFHSLKTEMEEIWPIQYSNFR